MDELEKGVICPEFHEFVAENENIIETEESKLMDLENYFDPENNRFQNSFVEDDNHDEVGTSDEIASSSNDKKYSGIDGLLECIDGVKRDYSFFNPKLLANWKGPKSWKAQAMMKALKSCNAKERKNIISDSNIEDEIEELDQQKITNKKKRTKEDENNVKIDWRAFTDDEKEDLIKIISKEKIMPRTLQKWNPVDNIGDTESIVVDVAHEFTYLEYQGIRPNWWKPEDNLRDIITCEKEIVLESLLINQNVDDCNETATEGNSDMPPENDELVAESNIVSEELSELNKTQESQNEDGNVLQELTNESSLNIGALKKEISMIIDQKCIKIDSDDDWSSKIYFSNLMESLMANDETRDLTISIVMVALLHLTNDIGLRLNQELNPIKDIEEISISKPMNKT